MKSSFILMKFCILLFLVLGINSNLISQSNINKLDYSQQELIVNPYMKWGTLMGCLWHEWYDGYSILKSKDEAIYIAGSAKASCHGTSGSYSPYHRGSSDGFLQKFTLEGEQIWGAFYGGFSFEDITDMVEDSHGNIIITGNTGSPTHISTEGAHQEEISLGTDTFIAKFNSNGERIWGTYYGGDGTEFVRAITLDSEDNIFVCGQTSSIHYIATENSYQEFKSESVDAYFAKFSPDGVLLYATYYGGNGFDVAATILIDNENSIYLAGNTDSEDSIATQETQQPHYVPPYNDGFLAKFTPNGDRIWGTYIGDWPSDEIMDICCDADNNIYAVGMTGSVINIASENSHQPNINHAWEGFIVKYNPQGLRVWGTYYGGEDWDYLTTVSYNKYHNMIHCGGHTNSTTGISTIGAHQYDWYVDAFPNNNIPSIDGMLIGFSLDGERKWGTYIGSDRSDNISCIFTDSISLYYTGSSGAQTSEYLTTPNCHQDLGTCQQNAIFGRFSLVDTLVGTASHNLEYNASIFPNPAKNRFTIKSVSPFSSYVIYNYQTQLIHQEIIPQTIQHEVNIPLAKGLYFIELTGDNYSEVLKLQKL